MNPDSPNAVIDTKTLDRDSEPVIVYGSQIPSFAGLNVNNIFVWAFVNGSWKQVVFQIDEANGTFMRKDVPTSSSGPQLNYYDGDDGLMDSNDEICFMANETGDRVNAAEWAPGADTATQRYEITVSDPITGNTGWVYIYYYTTPPAWTTVDYVSWNEATNYLDAYGYYLDYTDDDTHQVYFTDMAIKGSIGGDDVDMVDRLKRVVSLDVTLNPVRNEEELMTQFTDHPQYYHEYRIRDGPVRVLRHLKWTFGSANLIDPSDYMGWTMSLQATYYPSMFCLDEYLANWHSDGTYADSYSITIDHQSGAGPMDYYNSESGSGTINGIAGDDSVPSNLMSWDQVSSAHGSYVGVYQITPFNGETTTPITIDKTTLWTDQNSDPDNDGGRSGAEVGKYGDHGIFYENTLKSTNTDENDWKTGRQYYYYYMLPGNSPNVGADYSSYADSPLSTSNPTPISQTWIDDKYAPETVAGTVLVNGGATYSVALSAASSVTLAATVDDTGHGDFNIQSAVWTDGFAAFPGTAMSASDGTFDSVSEGVTANLDLSTWSAGVHEIYVYGTDENLNQNITSTEHATITITDDLAPATNGVLIDGLGSVSIAKSAASSINITAAVSDAGRGNMDITGVEWTIGYSALPGTPMLASDGAFDEVTEDAYYVQDISAWDAGTYEIYAYGTDSAGQQNTTSAVHATLTIIDDMAPRILGVTINGQATYDATIADTSIILQATLDDSITGGTNIGGANYTIGLASWPSTAMIPVDALDSDIEDFSNTVDITGWAPGTYIFYIYGWDITPQYNNSGGAFAVLRIINNMAPAIENVLVNGVVNYPVQYSGRSTVLLTATLNDTNSGGDDIAGANYTVGMANWPGSTMTPDDALDSPVENFSAVVDISTWAVGIYDLYPYGWDISNDYNSTSAEHASVTITDDLPPEIWDARVNGLETYVTDNSAAGTVTLTGLVDDTLTGNSIIAGANYTVGTANWPGVNMSPQDVLDTDNESFTVQVDISTWGPGTYRLYVYGWDSIPAYNATSAEYATIIIHDVLAPAVSDVRINGSIVYTISNENATTVDLTALVDDTGHGNSIIDGANYTLGNYNWPGSPMSTYNDEAQADIPVVGTVSGDYLNTSQFPDDGIYESIQEVTDPQFTVSTLYDYSTGAGTDKFAYVTDSNDAPATAINSETELSGAQYTAIGTSDDSRYTSIDPGWGDYVSIRGNMYLTQTPSGIDSITLLWEGYVSRAGNVNIYARDQTAGTWTLVNGGAAGTGGDGTIQGTLTGITWSDYVTGASNEFIFLVQYMNVDGLFQTTTMTTDYIGITVNQIVPGIEHRWQFDMGANPTFYVDASNPASSDNSFGFQWSDDSGSTWYDFTTPIIYAPGEIDVQKSSTIALASYVDYFLVRAITISPGTNADTLSIDRMWAEGQFNNNPEAVHASVDISSWQPGTYSLYVYGWDITPQYNTTSQAYATLIITDAEAPEIYGFLVNGTDSITATLGDYVIFTGLVSDDNTGGSNIANAFITTDGEGNWNSSLELTNDTWLDSSNETFTGNVSLSNWTHGIHKVFMYGSDALGNVNDTSRQNVTVNVIDNKPPETVDWSITLNDQNELWINPLISTTIWVNATINDMGFGYSNIVSANWTIGPVNWDPANNSMSPIDGAWDEFNENVTDTFDISTWVPDTYMIFVYGADEWGNNRTDATSYALLHIDTGGPEIIGPWADDLSPYLFVTDDTFQLKAYGDDRNRGQSDIVAAEYFTDSIGADGTGTPMVPTGFRFDSPYEGAKADIDCSGWPVGESHTYYVHFLDSAGYWGDMGNVFVARQTSFAVPVHPGWNLISLPIVTSSANINDMLSDISWDRAAVYDQLDVTNPWHSNLFTRADSLDEFTDITPETGLWVYVTDVGDGFIDLTGGLPGTTSINLYAGWNLVGYTTLNSRQADQALLGTGADMISIYNGASPYLIEDRTDLSTVTMNPGEAYWVHVPADTVWTIDW